MKNLLRAALLSSMLLLGAHHAAAQVAIGIQIGPPPPPRHYVVPVSPGPEYAWVDGYWYPVSGRYVWHKGYWTRPMPAHAGSALVMKVGTSTPATGMARMAGSNTIIIGTMTTAAITIAGTTKYR